MEAAGSIIGILQATSNIIQYVTSATGATKERIRLRHEIQACERILQDLRDLAGDPDDEEDEKEWREIIESLEAPGAPLCRLQIALRSVTARLQPPKERRVTRKAKVVLRWPFEEKEIKEIFAAIEREKLLLQLALNSNSRKLIQAIKKTQDENTKALENLTMTMGLVSMSVKEGEKQFSEIKEGIGTVQDSQGGIQKSLNKKEIRERRFAILNWLTPISYDTTHSDFISWRQPGTGQWLHVLELDKYKTWRSRTGRTIFCHGIPGAGKTILSSILIDDLLSRSREDKSIGVAFIYCNFNRQIDQTLPNLLANILKQLGRCCPSIPECLNTLYEQYGEQYSRPSSGKIYEALRSVSALFRRVFIVIDALDECQVTDNCRQLFLANILELQRDVGVNLLVTSRNIPEIMIEFDKSQHLEVRASRQDIEAYVESKLSLLPRFVRQNQELRRDIKTKIVGSVDGMFLLAHLHTNSLTGATTPRMIRDTLRNVDTGVDAYKSAYETAMSRIQGQARHHRELAECVLMWVSRTEYRLTVYQIQHALAVEYGEPILDPENIPDVADLVSVCAGLVTVDEESNIIRLVHYTTQEYFSQTWQRAQGTCQAVIDFLNSRESFDEIGQILFHVSGSSGINFTSTHTAAYFGLLQFIQANSDNPKLNTKDSLERTPLYYATRNGYEDIVEFLLGIPEIDTELQGDYGRTPLTVAAENGYESIVKMLLAVPGANPSKRSNTEHIPLDWAAANSHRRIMELIIQATHTASLESRDKHGYTTLFKMVLMNHEEAVKQLFSRPGIDPDPKDNRGRSPLLWAAANGHERIMTLLLEMPAVDPNSGDEIGQTPLFHAAAKGNRGAIKLLLQRRGVNADTSDKFGSTPFSVAASAGHLSIFKILLNTTGGVNPHAKNSQTGHPPLYYAAMYGYESILELLLGLPGADPNVQGKSDGGTALMHAVYHGRESSVRLLLSTPGIELNIRNRLGKTALSMAAKRGNVNIVEMLLQMPDVDPGVRDDFGFTPLEYATRGLHSRIMEMIQQKMS